MTDKEKSILKILVSYLQGEIDFRILDNKWIENYIEDEEEAIYIFEDSFYEIAEFIYWGSEQEPTKQEKLDGVLGPEELKRKIKVELEKNPNWKYYISNN